MKKRLLSILMALALCLSLLPVTALAAGPDVWDGSTKAPSGSGSESDPYHISTGEELAWLATLAADGSYFVELTNDIILNDGTFDQSGSFTKTGEPLHPPRMHGPQPQRPSGILTAVTITSPDCTSTVMITMMSDCSVI